MFTDYLKPKQELFIMFSRPTLECLSGNCSNNDSLFIHYYDTEDNVDMSYDIVDDVIDMTKGTEYEDRQYSIIVPTKEQESKLIVLKNIGLEAENIICQIFLEGKIQSFKWESYN